ncbi:haloacid dehalogenase [Mycobacterium kyorinense]|uniref:Haloacid dehalogenase n=1 Tax=Mycobacterium kyorinense TaxID=487514 RepID=A0A1A2Z4E9_9MYCO|nr:Cof-type HAD-IIB family hydrolase [Mycobacterium kyorinense]OBI44337.1 haloacid dehalogenase [Mycobacterium kyorinense]
MATDRIRLLLADVDGTLVDQQKQLTDAAVDAVRKLHDADVLFAVTSGRPPKGMAMLIDPLDLKTPIAGFNGGIFVKRDMSVIEQKVLPDDLVVPIAEVISSHDLDVWIYQGADWYVPDMDGSHVDRESKTVQFKPKVMKDAKDHTESVAKIVGVSDDHDAVKAATQAVQDRFGDRVAASPSQPYYLDVTHPEADKGSVAKYLAAQYQLTPEQIATIGDMPNDILMFEHSGLTIAMGNADEKVKAAAKEVTDSNDNDGFAKAVERFVLPEA